MGLGLESGWGLSSGWGFGFGLGGGDSRWVGVLARLRGREPLGRVEHEGLLEQVGELQHLLGMASVR